VLVMDPLQLPAPACHLTLAAGRVLLQAAGVAAVHAATAAAAGVLVHAGLLVHAAGCCALVLGLSCASVQGLAALRPLCECG
jgi:hypothetical protein